MQGNGTAAIFDGDERVTTFDMHGRVSLCPHLISEDSVKCSVPQSNRRAVLCAAGAVCL